MAIQPRVEARVVHLQAGFAVLWLGVVALVLVVDVVAAVVVGVVDAALVAEWEFFGVV